MTVSDSAIAAIYDLCASPSVVAGLREVIDYEISLRMDMMRNLLRDNNISAAQAAEGGIAALEELPSILSAWAARYEVNRV